jgi:hypothetical protein
MPPTKRSTPFQKKHVVQYGLKISPRDPETKTVTYVFVGFVVSLAGKKRKPSSVRKSFKVAFRPALLTQHLEGQYSFKWTEYQTLASTEKESFFKSVVPVVNTLNAHFVGAGDQLFFNIDVSIVEPSFASYETVESALMMFQPMHAATGDENATHYRVHIKNVKLFKLVVGQVALGCSLSVPSDCSCS